MVLIGIKKYVIMEEYKAPVIELIEITVEQGFVGSINGGLGNSENMDDGDINVDW